MPFTCQLSVYLAYISTIMTHVISVENRAAAPTARGLRGRGVEAGSSTGAGAPLGGRAQVTGGALVTGGEEGGLSMKMQKRCIFSFLGAG